MPNLHSLMQILTDELVKEVENSITEFKQHNQEYDEERVKAQVTSVSVFKFQCYKAVHLLFHLFCSDHCK